MDARAKKAMQELIKREKQKAVRFDIEEFCFPRQLVFVRDDSKFKVGCTSRRCLAEGTLVLAEKGPTPIEELKVGDKVYNEEGKLIKVTDVIFQGRQETVSLCNNGQEYVRATDNHVFNTIAYAQCRKKSKIFQSPRDRKVSEFYKGVKIVRKEVDFDYGNKKIDYAYALGMFLGDGCSRSGLTGKRLYLSSNEEKTVKKVAEILKCKYKKNSGNNYTWTFFKDQNELFDLPLYNRWCKGRYAHEKIIDLEEVKTWDRQTQLQLLAGLIDSDGSVYTTDKGTRLHIQVGMQAKSVIECVQYLMLTLFQVQTPIKEDVREKYKNGNVYHCRVSHNYHSQRILKELNQYLVVPSKKYQEKYDSLVFNNFNPEGLGITKRGRQVENTWDITVDSPTSLFLLANGLVSHNSGKTISCVAEMLECALAHENSTILYITLNRQSAKRIIWRDLKKVIRDKNVECSYDNGDLTVEFPNGSIIYLAGAKDINYIENFRGLSIKLCFIDEAQSFRNSILRYLLNDIIIPGLYDVDGRLRLIGTPSIIPMGVFYEAFHGIGEFRGFSKHHWTLRDNPWIKIKSGKEPEEILAEERKRKGITEDDPSYRRESLGEWVEDREVLVFKYSEELNTYDTLPKKGEWNYVLGVDSGYCDADALCVLAYSHQHREVYMVEEVIVTNQGWEALADIIRQLEAKYKFTKRVLDYAAGAKKFMEDFWNRYQIRLDNAEKTRKIEFIDLLNTDLRLGRLKVKKDMQVVDDFNLVRWDKDKSTNYKRVVSNEYHSDICDSLLYAWRECRNYLQIEEEENPDNNSDAYMAKLEKEESDRLIQQEQEEQWYDDMMDMDFGI